MYDCLPSINLTPQCSSRTRNFGVSTCFKLPQYVNCGILDSKWSSICAINSNRFGDDRPYFSDEHGNEALDFGLFERDKDREIRLTGDHKGKQDEAEMVEQPAKSGVNESDLSIGDIFKFRGQKKDEIAKPQKLDSEFEESDEPKMRRQMLRRSNIMAKQVISIRSAFALGFVSQLWVDPNSWVVMVVEVKPNLLSGDSDRFLLKEIRQVGDVILVHDENVISDDLKLVGLETLVGYTVVTPRRHNVGKVRGYTFNINSGTVESLELDSFGISIIPSSLVSTYALFVDDVLEVFPDTVVVRDAAVSRIQRLTKGFWNGPNASKSNDIEERLNADGGYTGKRRRSRKSSTKKRKSEDDWQLPMDYLYSATDLRPPPDPASQQWPKNPSSISTNHVETKQRVEIISWRDSSNKENIPPSYSTPIEKECLWSESINTSLTDELNAIQERLVRLRIEKDNNETMLRERGLMLDLEMKEIVDRGEVQKMLEMEVDRLYRLKEIRLACMRTSLIRSLRDKEEEKKMRLDQLKKAHTKAEERDGTEANSKN